MTVTRRNILDDPQGSTRFLDGCVRLSDLGSPLTAGEAHELLAPQVPGWSMRGEAGQRLSWWDLFVLWHYVAMQLATPGSGGNRAHGGPVFLPWHRMFLIRLEQVLQQVTDDPDLSLPYWDWADDGALLPSQQFRTALWTDAHLGPARGQVTSGPLGGLRVSLTQRWTPQTGQFLEAHAPRPIQRAAGSDRQVRTLPTRGQVASCLQEAVYDTPAWDTNAAGFRNHVEGWRPEPPGLHNRVHVWIGGDMSPGTSPNDPAFYLNHCNVDRIWEAKIRRSNLDYQPTGATPGAPAGHRLEDPMVALIGQPMTPQDVLDPTEWYVYDDLTVDT